MKDTLCYASDQIMVRITSKRPGITKHAMDVLLWLSYAEWPLKVDEISHAVAVNVGNKDLDRGAIIHRLDLSVCAGLAVIDESNQYVRLVHHTTREYLERHHLREFSRDEPPMLASPKFASRILCSLPSREDVAKAGTSIVKEGCLTIVLHMLQDTGLIMFV